ncbi:MAG: NAD-dependent epimerase/dehydratase family protein [Actinomycetota bacterium]
MRILFFGGTQFVGRHMAERAIERGHEVTLFTRGKTNPGVVAGAEEIHGDRTGRARPDRRANGGLGALAGLSFDRVIDVSGYVPRVVRQSAELLRGIAGHYTFVSTVSVYGDFSSPGITEDSPLRTMPDETVEDVTDETYGPLKVLCENVVHEIYGDDCTIVRPGFVVGPFDYTDRFPYWCARAQRGGDMLAPDDPHRPIQFVDARDLASFTVDLTERPTHGYFNATGPASPLTWGRFLDACVEVIGEDTELEWVPKAFLHDREVDFVAELSLYTPEDSPGSATVDCDRAIAAGLEFRALGTTIEDTPAWMRSEERKPSVGMAPEREAEILDAWRRFERYGS